jgi:hypothetical protein
MAADEGASDLRYAETAQDVKNKRDLRLLRQTGMTAGEHHAKLVVFDRIWPEEFLDD